MAYGQSRPVRHRAVSHRPPAPRAAVATVSAVVSFELDRNPVRIAEWPTTDWGVVVWNRFRSRGCSSLILRATAISLSPSQNASSTLTLVLRPAKMMERLLTELVPVSLCFASRFSVSESLQSRAPPEPAVAERGLVVSKLDEQRGCQGLKSATNQFGRLSAGSDKLAFYRRRSIFGPCCVCVPVGPPPASLNRAYRHPPSGRQRAIIGFTKSSTTASGSWLAGTLPASACSPAMATIGAPASR